MKPLALVLVAALALLGCAGEAQFSDFLELAANFGYQREPVATAAIPPSPGMVQSEGNNSPRLTTGVILREP